MDTLTSSRSPHNLAHAQLLYLVVVELLREAHAGMGEDATSAIEVMFFVGFFLALLLERALAAA